MNNVVLVGKTSRAQYRSEPHTHTVWELVYYLSGEGTVHVEDRTYFFHPGDIIIQPPHIPHYDVAKDGVDDIFVLFSHCDFPPDRALFLQDTRGIAGLLEQMHTEYHSPHENRMIICEALMNVLYQYVIAFRKEEREETYSPQVLRFIDNLIENFSRRDYTIQDAMQEIPYAEDYFRKIFKAETGKTPVHYLHELRLNHAKQLLRDSSFRIKDVSQMCGFEDPYYFSRLFKKNTGLYPSEWAARAQNGETFDLLTTQVTQQAEK